MDPAACLQAFWPIERRLDEGISYSCSGQRPALELPLQLVNCHVPHVQHCCECPNKKYLGRLSGGIPIPKRSECEDVKIRGQFDCVSPNLKNSRLDQLKILPMFH